MDKPRIYVETTIPSFYFETRQQAAVIARRDWTRDWWQQAILYADLFTSVAVIEELSQGPLQYRQSWLSFVEDLPLLPINEMILEVVEAYVKHLVMPKTSSGDALHLAIASCHQCDFLVTWNCKHLANANKFDHIRKINSQLGLWIPTLTTPLELLEQSDEPDDH